jgi:Fe-S cluster assembly iron-binding protein IscA
MFHCFDPHAAQNLNIRLNSINLKNLYKILKNKLAFGLGKLVFGTSLEARTSTGKTRPSFEKSGAQVSRMAKKLARASSSCFAIILFITTLSLLNPTASYSQVSANPVQVTSNLIPPYSLYLSDYSDANQNKWNIQLLLKDFTQTNYQAKLRITIEGAGIRLRTRRGYSPGPIRLDPGIPYQVDAMDLSSYLNIQNMEVSGINRNQLASTQKLTEGFYQFKIEVLDYNRNNRVSNIGTSMAWLVLNDPPLLNLPFEEKLRLQDPQQIQFQWTPRHTSSPNSAFETEYIFRLWEMWPEGRDPNEVARTTRPLLETTIMTTSYFYGLNDAMLIPGRSYAWQVQAINLSGRDLFKNQGKSEVKSFQYGDACQPITNLGAEVMGTDRIRITWQGEWNHNRYVAQIREKGEEQWFNYGTNLETQVVYELKANTEYDIRVIPSCGAIDGDAENILTLKTLEQEIQDFDCGAEPNRPEITNQEPIEQLQIGDRITAAGFTVILTELNQLGDTYTGRGLIEVPLFNGARVDAVLNNIRVNTDKQLISGNIESVYNPKGPFIIGMDKDEPGLSEEGTGDQEEGEEDSFDELPEADIDIEGEIADVIVDEDTGTITVIDSDGNETEIDPETADENEDGNVVIEDSNGDTWVVDDDGEVSEPTNPDNNTNGGQENTDGILFEYLEEQYQDRATISLAPDQSNHSITVLNVNEEEYSWSAIKEGQDITPNVFIDNPTNTETANIIIGDEEGFKLQLAVGKNSYSVDLTTASNTENDTDENEDGNSAEDVKIWFNEDNQEYANGETITIDYTSDVHDVAFQLKNYPENTESFKWHFMHNNVDHTIDVKNNEDNLDNFGMDIGSKAGDIKLIAEYDDQSVEVIINVIKKEFSADDIKAIDKNNTARVAKEKEILYLVDGNITNSSRDVAYEVSIDPDLLENEYSDLNLAWSYENQSTTNLEHEFGIKTITRTVVEEEDIIRTNVKAGYPDEKEIYVDVLWIDENKITVKVIPTAVQNEIKAVLNNFKKVKTVTDRFKSLNIKIEPYFNITGTQINIEDDQSNLYKNRQDGSINAGVNFKYEVPLPPPYSFDFTIPILDYTIGEVGAFINLNVTAGVSGTLRKEKYFSEQQYEIVENLITVSGSGSVIAGAKIELLSDYENVTCDFRFYGTAKAIVSGSYIISDGNDDFRFNAYLEPLIATASGKIEAGGYVVFDNSLSYQVFQRVDIYPSE